MTFQAVAAASEEKKYDMGWSEFNIYLTSSKGLDLNYIALPNNRWRRSDIGSRYIQYDPFALTFVCHFQPARSCPRVDVALKLKGLLNTEINTTCILLLFLFPNEEFRRNTGLSRDYVSPFF